MARRVRPTNDERAAKAEEPSAEELPWTVERAAQDFGYDPSQVLAHTRLADGRAVLVMRSGHKLIWPDHIAKAKEIPEHQKRGERIPARQPGRCGII